MHSGIRVYVYKPPKKPPKPFLPLIGSNLIRLIIDYLTYNEFIELCLCCTKLQKYFIDRYVKFSKSIPKSLITDNLRTYTAVREYYSVNNATQGRKLGINYEWKNVRITFFHYAILDLRQFAFIFHNNIFDIKELINYSIDLISICSKEFRKNIIKADGYQNKVVLAFADEVKMLVLSQKSDIYDENPTSKQEKCFIYPHQEKNINYLLIFNKGKNVLVGFKTRVYVLNQNMEIYRCHNIEILVKDVNNLRMHFSIHVPSKQAKSYLIYNLENIWVFRLGIEKPTKIENKIGIDKVGTSSVNNHPELVYTDNDGGVYLNQHKLKLTCKGSFTLFQGNMIYQKKLNKNKFTVHNFLTGKEFYKFSVSEYGIPQIIGVCPYKIFFMQNSKLYFHSIVTETTHAINLPFSELYEVTYLSPLLVLTGKIKNVYGVVILDFYRKSESDYLSILEKIKETF